MIDTHAHIDAEQFDEDRQEVIERAFEKGLESIIIPAIDEKGHEGLLKLAESDKRLFCSMGIHPHHAKEVENGTLYRIEENIKHDKVKAVGEIGLDYYYDFAPPKLQEKIFRDQIQIAKQEKLPIIVHNRESDDDMLRILEDEQDGNLKGVLHCFSSDSAMLEKALELGFNISFTGNITFKKTGLGDVVKKAPLDRIMIETDSPYMTPVPNRGKRNEPSYVKFVAEKIAEYKSISIEEVISMTSKTAKNFFNLTLMLLLFVFVSPDIFAQYDSSPDGEEEYFDYEEEEYEGVHPYPKFLGLSVYGGTNTIVDTYYLDAGEKDESFEGLFAYGFGFLYSPLDYMILEASYFYSKNEKLVEEYSLPGFPVEPNYHHALEFCAHWTPNPYSRINVFGTTGMTMMLNTFDTKESNSIAFSSGIGFYGNINTGIGLFNIIAEWRINFALNHFDAIKYEKESKYVVEASTFHSIPRFGIAFYPNF